MKDKLKLARNLILISIPLILLCALAYLLPMSYMTTEYVMWQEEYENSRAPHTDASTLIIGDSRAKSSVLPKELHEGVYNIGIGGCTPIEMYHAVKNYIDHNGAPERAIIIFAPYHMCDIDNWDQTLYFNFLSAGELTKIYGNALKTKDPVVASHGRLAEMAGYKLRLPSKYLAQMYDAKLVGNKTDNLARFDSIREDLGYLEFGNAPGDDGEDYEVHHEEFDSDALVILYYEKLLDLLSDNNVKVLITQAPVNEASSQAMHPAFISGFSDFMHELEYRRRYYDMTVESDIPVYPNELYGDANHLNRKGAERFTEELRQHLDDIGFWDMVR